MGNSSICQKVETEEETINKIIESMKLTQIETDEAYSEFIETLDKTNLKINYFPFKKYINIIIGDDNYSVPTLKYLENLRNNDFNQKNAKKIGTFVILCSNSEIKTKLKFLMKHFTTFYIINDQGIKEFVTDIIELHTDYVLSSFKDNLRRDEIKLLSNIWTNSRKNKLLAYILENYESVQIKYKRIPSIETINLDESVKSSIIDDENSFEDKLLKEFLELSYCQITGEYIRNWLYEDSLNDNSEYSSCL